MKKIFKRKEIIEGGIVDLRFNYFIIDVDGIPTVYFHILKHDTKQRIGNIELRLKIDKNTYYYGHIGYEIYPKYQGHNYSYYACLLLFDIAKNKYELKELIVTCNPDNIASYKILNKLKGELVEIVDVPKNHQLYRIGDKMKCIFKYRLMEDGKD